MAGGPQARPDSSSRRKSMADYNAAMYAYAAAVKSLSRLVERSEVAVDAWSTLTKSTFDTGLRKAANAASESIAERKGACETLLEGCRLDGDGLYEVFPGMWTGEIAAGAEGMAALASRAAARWSARGALLSASTEPPVLAEMSASKAWRGFAKKVAAAERAAEGTELEARPVDELAAVAARGAERLARARGPFSVEEVDAAAGVDGHGGGTGGLADVVAATAGRRAAADARDRAAREAAESKALLRDAVDVWMEASAEWARARDRAAGEGDKEVASMADEQAAYAGKNAARLRTA